MTVRSPRQTPSRFSALFGGALLGTLATAAGLLTAYLTGATPIMSTLVADAPLGGGSAGIGIGAWSFGMIAGGAMIVAGTSQLAVVLTAVRNARGGSGTAARALASVGGEVVVASGVVPIDGPPIPELVIGAFGAVVIHAAPSAKQARRGEGTVPPEGAVGLAMRDADRVRRWLAAADLDFVVRVYAAVVVGDRAIERTPSCAVVTAELLPAWIASLPRQRSLNAGRRGRLLSMARTTSVGQATPGRAW